MVPFRIFDRERREMWIVLNFHPSATDGGKYLLAREDDSEQDGEIKLIGGEDMAKYRLVDFLDEAEEYDD